MRMIAFLVTLLSTMPLGFVAPFLGLLVWGWLSFMSPHTLLFAGGRPYVLMAASVTAVGWIFSSEPKRIPRTTTPWLLAIFLFWMVVSTYFALEPNSAWGSFSRQWKTIALAFAVLMLVNNRVRVTALTWVIVLSIGYFAIKGGMFTVLKGGVGKVFGPDGTEISDNNKLGAAMIMIWPLAYYLRQHSADRMVRWGLTGLLFITVFAVLGTWSRGAFLGVAVVAAYFWWKARRKVVVGVCGAAVLAAAFVIMPNQWLERMSTIQTYDEDGSAAGRIREWGFAIRLAEERPWVGGGFDASQQAKIVMQYVGSYRDLSVLAYHSIWFQTLGDLGVPGFILFVLIGGNALYQLRAVRRAARSRPDLAWAEDLAIMMRLTFVGYMAAGSFLSMAYYDLYYTLVACSSALYQIVVQGAPAIAQPATWRPMALPLEAASAKPAQFG